MKKALIFWGGWDIHEPKQVAQRFQKLLGKNGFAVDLFEGVDCLCDKENLLKYDLIVPSVTLGTIPNETVEAISFAVRNGVGLAGCHGGMCDSFRQSTLWQFITGGQWVSHPGGDKVKYTVNIHYSSSPIIEGIEDFEVTSEQYYLHIDPAIEVLASTRFPLANDYHTSNKPVLMPVAWTKYWGYGRVFYCSVGHKDEVFEKAPSAELLMEKGMLWAAGGKECIKGASLI